jgi:hypothetical protein
MNIDLLDKALQFFYEDPSQLKVAWQLADCLFPDRNKNIEPGQIEQHFVGIAVAIIKKLENDNYVYYYEHWSEGPRGYRITFDGLLFFEKGAFKSQYKAERAKYNWTIAKTIATVANAIIIILLTWFTIVVSNKTNQQEKQIQVYEDSIHKLNLKIK